MTADKQGAPLEIRTDRFDAVIFDLDGVITDTASVHGAAWKQMFDAFQRGIACRQCSYMSTMRRVDGTGGVATGELVAALAAADARHQAAAAQQPHQLVNVRRAQALPLGELGSGQRAFLLSSDLEQAAEPVFLLRRQSHAGWIRKAY